MSGTLSGGEDFSSIFKWLRSLPSSSTMDRMGSSMEDVTGAVKHSYDNTLAFVAERSKKWDKDIKLKDKERDDIIPKASFGLSSPKPLPVKEFFNDLAVQGGISRHLPLKASGHSSEPARMVQLSESSAALIDAQHTMATISASSSLDIVRHSGDHIHDSSSIASSSVDKALHLASVSTNFLQNNCHHNVPSASEAVGGKNANLRNGRKKITAKDINTNVFSTPESSNSYQHSNAVDSLVTRSFDGFADICGSQISNNSIGSDDSKMKEKISKSQFTASGPIFSFGDNRRRGSLLSTTISLPEDIETPCDEIAINNSNSSLAPEHSEDEVSVARTSLSQVGSCSILDPPHGSENFLPLGKILHTSNSIDTYVSNVKVALVVPYSHEVVKSLDDSGDHIQNPLFRRSKRGSVDYDKDTSRRRESSHSSDEDGSSNAAYKNSKDSWRQSTESEPAKQYSPRMEKKRITAAMLNQFRAENAETKLSVGLSGTHQSSNDHSKEFLLPIESVSNLGLQKSCTGSSLCLDDLRKEFLNGPNSLAPTTRKHPEHHSPTMVQIKTLKGILKSENIAKPSNGESTSHMVPSHDSLHEATGPKKVLRWDKTQVYVFEQSEEESLLRGDSASKKDKKRDLMRI